MPAAQVFLGQGAITSFSCPRVFPNLGRLERELLADYAYTPGPGPILFCQAAACAGLPASSGR
jgi:hypothetical protein